jgi:hypothetical protein
MNTPDPALATTGNGFANSKLLRLAQYYETRTSGAPMPRRKLFHPNELSWLFGYFYTVDVLRNDYRFGFIGPFWVAMYNYDPMGVKLSEMENCGRMKALRPMYDDAIAQKQSNYCVGRMVWPNGKSILHERITVPFSDDNGEPSMLLVAAQCDRSLPEAMLRKGFGEPRLELGGIVHPAQLSM